MKLLLDTPIILPILGVKVDLPSYEEVFPRILSEHEAYCATACLHEARLLAYKLFSKLPQDRRIQAYKRLRDGFEALLRDERLRIIDYGGADVESEAVEITLEHGIEDPFDALVIAMAKKYQLTLLTTIETAAAAVRAGAEALSWDELIEKLGSGKEST